MSTIAAFLHEKAGNMARWLKENGLPVDLPLEAIPPVQLVAFAQELKDTYSEALQKRDFDLILCNQENLRPEMAMTVSFVQKRPELHDKFWRYLSLFSDTVSTAQ